MCISRCTIHIPHQTTFHTHLIPYNLSTLSESFKTPRGHNISHLIPLPDQITLFGRVINKLYVSPKGCISTGPLGTFTSTRNNISVIASYVDDTTNRFVGDVYVDITKNSSLCRLVFDNMVLDNHSHVGTCCQYTKWKRTKHFPMYHRCKQKSLLHIIQV